MARCSPSRLTSVTREAGAVVAINKYASQLLGLASGPVARVRFDTAGARLALDGELTASWIGVGRDFHICQSKVSDFLFGIELKSQTRYILETTVIPTILFTQSCFVFFF